MKPRLEDLIRADHPGLDDPATTADGVFLLLEGAIAHRGIDGDGRLLTTARSLAVDLVHETPGTLDGR